jgi:hypothetical protein
MSPVKTALTVLCLAVAVGDMVRKDAGVIGVRAVIKIARECMAGSEWCDHRMALGFGILGLAMVPDPWTETAAQVAETHAPGAGSLKGKVAIVTGVSPRARRPRASC